MLRNITRSGQILSFITLAMCLSCSPRSTPVQESVLVGEWQRVDKPAIHMTFLKDGTFSAQVAGERLVGGKFQLVDGKQIVLDFDASSPKLGRVTNVVSMAGEELRIVPANGSTERYKRVQQQAQ